VLIESRLRGSNPVRAIYFFTFFYSSLFKFSVTVSFSLKITFRVTVNFKLQYATYLTNFDFNYLLMGLAKNRTHVIGRYDIRQVLW